MNNLQLAIFSAEAIIIALLMLFLFRMRSRFGLSPLYVTLGVFQPVQTILASTIYVEILPGVIVSPGSVIMFTASLFVILLIYIFEDAVETRKAIYGIMFANLTMTLLLVTFGVQVEILSTVNFLNLSREILNQNARLMLIGTGVLFVDSILLIMAYEAVWRVITRSLFLRIYLTIALILVFDSLFFITGAFYGQPDYLTILTSSIIGKIVMAGFYAFALTIYLRYAETTHHTIQPFQDIFAILSYRQKFEIEHQQRLETKTLLRESEVRYHTLARISPVGIFHTDPNGITTYVNPKWCEISGVPFTAALGNGWLNAVHVEDRERVDQGWQAATRLKQESSTDYRFLRPDGALAWVIGKAVPELNADEQVIGYVGTVTDITERKRAEEQIERQLQRLNCLHTIDMAITSSFDLTATLQVVLQQTIAQLKVDACTILLFDPREQTIVHAADLGFHSEVIQDTNLKLGEGYASRAILERQTIHISNMMETRGELAAALQLSHEAFVDYFGTPLIVKGEVK